MLDVDSSLHPRVRVSKQKITDALLSLLKKVKIEEITIRDLLQATRDSYGSKIGRQTFYRHFNSKLDVIEDFFWEYFKKAYLKIEELKASLPIGMEISMKSLDILFAEFQPAKDKFHEILTVNPDPILVTYLNSVGMKTANIFISELYRNVFGLHENNSKDELFYKIINSLASGSFSAIFSNWFTNEFSGSLNMVKEHTARFIFAAANYSVAVNEYKKHPDDNFRGYFQVMAEIDPEIWTPLLEENS